ncbi:hotdog fold thioesterase [Mycolicibacterium goodii]|uniref:PaaI family thioesterase n=1 Tax=Mycolicibacterium goodii TaxID=134601 RepID=UPI001BDD9927|nr:hotdog fold thioesterase [Mycolicibacterium goodii]MBU8815175.1 hotdog fold thioesterase [Mycolicibacterium goodii]
MRFPLNTPLGRMGIESLDETPGHCVASIPAEGLLNPLTGAPTLAPLAMLVDHTGGLVNHSRRPAGTWTVSSELAIEFAPDAAEIVASAPQIPVVATGSEFGPTISAPLAVCELTVEDRLVATATVRSVYISAPDHTIGWPDDPDEGELLPTLSERLSVEVAESGGATKTLRQLSDPVVNNSLGIVHGGISAAALELVASAAVNDGEAVLRTASLRVNYLRQFSGGPRARYEGTAIRVGRTMAVADAQAIGDDGKTALLARVTAYR